MKVIDSYRLLTGRKLVWRIRLYSGN